MTSLTLLTVLKWQFQLTMGHCKRVSKHERCFKRALAAVDKDVDRRRASLIARMPSSTYQCRLMNKYRKSISRTYLAADEENLIVDLVNRYSARGFPLSNEYIGDAFEILAASFPADRRARLTFVNNRAGKTFFRNFRARHRDCIRFRG